MKKRRLEKFDVIRVIHGPSIGKTGVVLRALPGSRNYCVVLKGEFIGVYYQDIELKRVGCVARFQK